MEPIRLGLVFRHSFAYYYGVLRGIRRYAEARPQWLLTSLTAEPQSLQQSLRVPGRFRPEGLIAAVNTKSLVRILSSWRRPLVNVAAVFPGLRFPYVGTDNVRVGRLAAAHFLERGLRHVGFIGSPDILFSTERGAAFGQTVSEAGHTVACYEGWAHLAYDPLGQQWDLDPALRRWLRALPRPVGVFVPTDLWGGAGGGSLPACRAARARRRGPPGGW